MGDVALSALATRARPLGLDDREVEEGADHAVGDEAADEHVEWVQALTLPVPSVRVSAMRSGGVNWMVAPGVAAAALQAGTRKRRQQRRRRALRQLRRDRRHLVSSSSATMSPGERFSLTPVTSMAP